MKYLPFVITFLLLLGLGLGYAPDAAAGAAVCREAGASGGTWHTTALVEGSGYEAYNKAIAQRGPGALCWSSQNLKHGYLVAIGTSRHVKKGATGGRAREYAAGFGATRDEALRKAIKALERNAVLWSWSESDGYIIKEERKF